MRSRKQGRYTGHLKTASGVPFLCTHFLVAERSWDPRLLSVPSSLPSSCASDNIACTRSRSSRIELEVRLLLSKCPPILALKINKCTNAWNDSLAVINKKQGHNNRNTDKNNPTNNGKTYGKTSFYGINNCFSSDILQLPFFTEIWGINTVNWNSCCNRTWTINVNLAMLSSQAWSHPAKTGS